MRSVHGVDRWQLGRHGEEAEPIKRAVKEAIHGPCRMLDGRVTLTGLAVCVCVLRVGGGYWRGRGWQTCRQTELGECPGTESGGDSGGGILVEKWLASRSRLSHCSHRQRGDHTVGRTPPHSCRGAGGGRRAEGALLKSRRCLRVAFKWMWERRGCVEGGL